MAYTEADLVARIAALETAFDRHERTVKYADREVTYVSVAEVKARIDYLQQKLSAVRRRPRQYVARASKGY